MVCFRYKIVNTLHEVGNNDDYEYDDDDNNKGKGKVTQCGPECG